MRTGERDAERFWEGKGICTELILALSLKCVAVFLRVFVRARVCVFVKRMDAG